MKRIEIPSLKTSSNCSPLARHRPTQRGDFSLSGSTRNFVLCEEIGTDTASITYVQTCIFLGSQFKLPHDAQGIMGTCSFTLAMIYYEMEPVCLFVLSNVI